MKLTHNNQTGFGVIGVLAAILVIVVVGYGGLAVYHHQHNADNEKAQAATVATNVGTPKSTTTQTPVSYAGWQSFCITSLYACIKYPAGWTAVANAPGAFQNSSETGYISLSSGTSKDGGQGTASIYSVQPLTTSATPVDIVGFVVNNQPSYEVFDASYVTSSGIKAGATEQLDYGNYAFTSRTGTVSLVATPNVNGYAAITTPAQANAWFATSVAQNCLKALESFSE